MVVASMDTEENSTMIKRLIYLLSQDLISDKSQEAKSESQKQLIQGQIMTKLSESVEKALFLKVEIENMFNFNPEGPVQDMIDQIRDLKKIHSVSLSSKVIDHYRDLYNLSSKVDIISHFNNNFLIYQEISNTVKVSHPILISSSSPYRFSNQILNSAHHFPSQTP